MRSRNMYLLIAVAIVASLTAADVMAQRGRGGGRGGPRGGGGATSLLNIKEVRDEIEMTDEQWADAGKIIEEARADRQRGDRPNIREMSEDERTAYFAKARKEAEQRESKLRKSLGDVVLDHQFARLDEIYIQVQGVAALQTSGVQEKLKITGAQAKELADTSRKQQESMREKMREIFQGGGQGGDRDQIRDQMTEMRKEMEKGVLAVLSKEQQQGFEKLKGEPFEMPQRTGRRRGRGQGGGGGGQPQRPE